MSCRLDCVHSAQLSSTTSTSRAQKKQLCNRATQKLPRPPLLRVSHERIMSAPHGGGGGGGDGGYGGMYRPPPPPPAGWMPQPIQQAPAPTRLPHTPIRTSIPPPIQSPVYSTGYPAQQVAYNQYVPGQVPNTAQPANSAMMYQHNHHGGQHRAVTHSPVQRHQTTAPGPDIPTALIALADTYIGAAHSTGYKTALGTGEDARAYSKLVATGLGCLEGVLQVGHLIVYGGDADGFKYRLQPRMEAMVRLRYAAILFEETENLDEAEEILNKGVRLCTCPALCVRC